MNSELQTTPSVPDRTCCRLFCVSIIDIDSEAAWLFKIDNPLSSRDRENRNFTREMRLNRWRPAQQPQALYVTCLLQILVVCPHGRLKRSTGIVLPQLVLAFHTQDRCQETRSEQLTLKTGTNVRHQPENLIFGFFFLTIGALSVFSFPSRTAGRSNLIDLSSASGKHRIGITPAA